MKISKIMMIIAIMIFTLFAMTACSKSDSESMAGKSASDEVTSKSLAVAVVAGWRSCVNRISVNAESISEIIYDSAYTYGSVSFARVDGKPEQYIKVNIPEPEVKGLSDSKLKSIAEGYREEILEAFNEMGAAKYPEADVLEAIRIEAATLRETGNDTEKCLVIVDSGLATKGYLDFTDDILDARTEDIIDELSAAKAIPDLSGINITWIYCGETAEPQQPLSEAQKEKLKEIYVALFEEAGAKDYEFREDVPTADPYTDLPQVSSVNADEREISVQPIKPIVIDSSKVQFIGDQAVFIDPENAKSELRKVADILLQNPENRVFVVGGTAGSDGNSKWCQELSDARANTVASTLIEFGVEPNRLKVIGLGSNTPWHIDDLDDNGVMIEEKAEKNRSVWIVDRDDPEYGPILEKY